jgi:hypothetical protein
MIASIIVYHLIPLEMEHVSVDATSILLAVLPILYELCPSNIVCFSHDAFFASINMLVKPDVPFTNDYRIGEGGKKAAGRSSNAIHALNVQRNSKNLMMN